MIIGFEELPSHLSSVASHLKPDELFRLLKDELEPCFRNAWERRFATQSNADGSPWSSDLIDTGELYSSLRVTVTRDGISAGPGGQRNVDVAGYQEERGNSVGGVDDELDEQIATALDNWMGRAFEGRF